MALTLKEVTEREEALRREITEREHLLGAYGRIREDLLRPAGATPAAALPPPLSVPSLEGELQPAPASPEHSPATIDPTLATLRSGWHGSRRIVTWAIQQMTQDYDLHDLAAVLDRAGCRLSNAKISVVLVRMKLDGEIQQVVPGAGRRGAVYRKPGGTAEAVTSPVAETSLFSVVATAE